MGDFNWEERGGIWNSSEEDAVLYNKSKLIDYWEDK